MYLFDHGMERQKLLELFRKSIGTTCNSNSMVKVQQRNKMVLFYSCSLVGVFFSAQLFFLYGQGKLIFTYTNFTKNSSRIFAIVFQCLNFFCCCVFTYVISFGPIFFINTFYYYINLMEIRIENVVKNIEEGNDQDVVCQNLKLIMQTMEDVSG